MAVIALLALVLDVLIGWPDAVYRRVGHPVTWAGRLIAALDRTLNQGRARRAKGALTVVVVLLAAMIPAVLIQAWLGPWVAAVLAWMLLGNILSISDTAGAALGVWLVVLAVVLVRTGVERGTPDPA